ncbi:MAG: hypothetical protein EA343_13520 [Nodularia sp. (in: Bacteria)]|nr:MAG: hypothetical protein EA343_13520 [Nodularia sp. (in: cyanobacteria)]
MLRNFKRAKLIFLAVLSTLFVSVSAFAQIPRTPATFQLAKSEVTATELRNATASLNQLETVLNQIERKKVVTLKDTQEVEKSGFSYAESMKTGLDSALKEAETLAKFEGKQGSINPLETFEKAEKTNQPRLKKIEEMANSIERQINAGEIILDRSVIQDLSISERRELLESLDPRARKIYLEQQPELFKSVLEDSRKTLKFLEDTFEKFQSFAPTNIENTFANYDVSMAVSGMMNSISNMLIPPAYAAAAIPCIPHAVRRDWPRLSRCVISAGSEAINIYNQFVRCWNSARNPLRWLKRTRCVTTLIIRLA